MTGSALKSEGRTIVDALESAATHRGDAVWFVDVGAPETGVTYTEVVAAVRGVAGALADRGLGPGDRVALSLNNRLEFLLAWFAANWLGAAIVPLNVSLRPREAEYIVGHSDAKLWVLDEDDEIRSVGAAVAPRVGSLVGTMPVQDVTRSAESRSGPDPVELRGDDIASILYTSGTTGNPKGCLCPHSYYIATGSRFVACIDADENERFATCLPLFHMNAQTMSTMGSLVSQSSLVVEDRFHPEGFFERLGRYRATVINYIGAIPAILHDLPPSEADRSHRLRVVYGGGIPKNIHAEVEERFGVPFLEGYGMTEVGMCISTTLSRDRKVGTGCCGTPQPGVLMRLVDPDGRVVEGPGEGELHLAGEGLFAGYHKMERSAAFGDDGWFRTGDILRRDDEGDLFFVDRTKHIIRRAGENISAREVEIVLARHEAVEDVAVIGVTDALRGQEVKAFVVPSASAVPSEELAETLRAYARNELAYFKVPRFIEFRSSFPRTPTQRIRKHVLEREEEAERADRKVHR